MKITSQQFAQSLYEAVADKTEKELKPIFKNFTLVLSQHGQLNKTKEIFEIFKEIWDRERGELTAELVSAREFGPSLREVIVNYLKNRTSARKINLKESVDKDLIGGFVLKYNSRILDGSLKSNLELLKDKISN